MKDFDNQKTDAPQDTAPAINKRTKSAHSAAGEPSPSVGEIASHANQEADVLSAPELSHPANATPLADLLGRLQHSHGNSYVQRVVADINQAKADVESQSTDQARSLDASTRIEMESAFGESFGDVRVHTGRDAEGLNEEVGARAVTRSRDIYFGKGEYNPSTQDGKELLAHELTHVVQQRGHSANREAGSVNQAGDKFEEEADRVANAVMRGEQVPVVNRSAVPSFQRQPRPGGPAQQIPGAIDLKRDPHGGLPSGITYAFDAAAHELTLQGPPQMSVSSIQGGQVVFDSARATMTASRTRTIRIRISGTPLSISVGGITFRFVP